jgi:hypothetical protein
VLRRSALITDYVTLQWSNLTSWDGLMHFSPLGWYPDSPAAALAVLWNTLNTSTVAEVTLPLYYAGFRSGSTAIIMQNDSGTSTHVTLAGFNATIAVQLAPLGVTYLVVNPLE